MTREQAAAEIKTRYAEYLQPAKVSNTYVCPLCGNGTGSTGDGMRKDPHGTGEQLKCFKCGFYGDVIDLYQRQYSCTAGEAFTALRNHFNITVDAESARTAAETRNTTQGVINATTTEHTPETATERTDYAEYLNACYSHRGDPAAVKYLSFRGISPDTATAYKIGYDANTGHVIIPASRYYYIARNTNPEAPNRYNNPKGAKIELFNSQALYNSDGRPVFIVEGAFDALSIIEAGGLAVSLNSVSNYRKVLDMIAEKNISSPIIVCLDNDDAGTKTAAELVKELQKLNIKCKIADVCIGFKDPNEALTHERDRFISAVKAAEQSAMQTAPGVLTLDRAVSILETSDDNYVEMPVFPQLSQMIKIKTHDTIVIAADTGAGKSSLALNILHDLQDRYPALYINLEMDEATIIQRLVAIHTGMNLDEIENYKRDNATRDKVNAAIREIVGRKEINLLTDAYELQEIEKQIKIATQGRTEPTVVFIDTGLLVTTSSRSVSRYERFTQISEELRRISRLNNVIMFVLLQQNRAGKQGEKEQPTNSSLKESGSWENDATKIMFLWQNEATKSKELVITKNRSGKTGTIKLNYFPHTQKYTEQNNSTGTIDKRYIKL